MKKLKKLKLNEFSKAELERRKMSTVKGGDTTACSNCSGHSGVQGVMSGDYNN